MQARRDFAHITKTPIVEKPYWFQDMETGNEYYGIYGCIGWPQKFQGRGDELPGYGCVLGVRKIEGQDPENAQFDILDDCRQPPGNEDLLIQDCILMRNRWGFGVHNDLMPVCYGDYRPFELLVADFNTKLTDKTGEEHAFIVSPPDDFDQQTVFHIYVSRLGSVLAARQKRLYLGNHQTTKNRLQGFKNLDPVIMGLGGLIHTLLLRQPWMEQSTPSVWQMPDL